MRRVGLLYIGCSQTGGPKSLSATFHKFCSVILVFPDEANKLHRGHNNCILSLQIHKRSITYIRVWAKIASQLHVVASVCY